MLDVTHRLKLLSTLLKFILNDLHTSRYPHSMYGSHRAASWGICLYCTYRSWFQTTEVEAPLDTGGSLKFLRRLHLNPPAPVNLQPAGSAQSQVGVKAKHLIA